MARNLFTYEDQVSFTHGRNQFTFGAWVQRVQSNEELALSQYGQATFTSLHHVSARDHQQPVVRSRADAARLALLYGALYAEDVIRLAPSLTLSLGFRTEFSNGWNEVEGRASTYTYTDGVINTQPHIGSSAFTENNATYLPQPRAGIAWSPFRNSNRTVIRAGFGMYNDLQDALGYRTDQNAPFNPTYSTPSDGIETSCCCPFLRRPN